MSGSAYQDALTRLRNGPQQGPAWTIDDRAREALLNRTERKLQ